MILFSWFPEPPESTAIMASPALGPQGLGCTFSLWYNCKDENPRLVMTAWTVGDLKDQIVSVTLSCSSNQEWRQGQMFIGEQDQLFTVRYICIENLWHATFLNLYFVSLYIIGSFRQNCDLCLP